MRPADRVLSERSAAFTILQHLLIIDLAIFVFWRPTNTGESGQSATKKTASFVESSKPRKTSICRR